MEGDDTQRTMIENTTKVALDGERFVDRAALGRGEPQWYSLNVYEGKEKKFIEELQARINDVPPQVDPSTGEVILGGRAFLMSLPCCT